MIVAVQGTKEFKDYNVFLRAMSVALSGMKEDDRDFIVYTAGPATVNSFVSEFCNLSERGMKARGKRIKFFKAAPSWISENIKDISYFAFLCKPSEKMSKLIYIAEENNVEVGIFKY